MSDLNGHMDAGTERLLEASLARRQQELDRRERAATILFSATFLLVAVALAVLGTAVRGLDWPLALGFVVALAVVARVEFSLGNGYAVPTEIVFVPMLLLLPTTYVPLLVAAAFVLSSVVHALRGGAPLSRSALAVGDAWFSLGPAVVLVTLGAQVPDWAHWPAFVAALASQLLLDGALTVARAHHTQGVPARAVLADLQLVYRVDLLLAPVGLLAAFAGDEQPATALLVLSLVYLLVVFSRDREAGVQRSLELGRAYRGTALLLRDLLEEDDEYTGRHTEDVVGLSVRVAERMELDEDTRRAAELGALLHDIGKIAVPDEIINKPGPLNDEEWAIMKTHTVEGERMLAQVGGLLADVGLVVRASHERWDGGGYPDGLAGERIPTAARIVSACDAYNAMTTDRSYRKSLGLEVAVSELRKNAGTQFDPDVVDALIAVVTEAAAAESEPVWQLQVAAEPAPAALPAPAPRPT
jgi:HD-GYP domain-containing protein (c-di-GMP phosphodiesterase class II)